jgi:hypothetical protein
MNRLEAMQHTMATWLGLEPKSRWDRLRELDWHDIVPTGRDLRHIGHMMPTNRDIRRLVSRRPNVAIDTTSLVVGLIVGVGIGVGAAYAVTHQGKPTIGRARRQLRKAADKVEGTLADIPARLNITRMEEEPTKKQ